MTGAPIPPGVNEPDIYTRSVFDIQTALYRISSTDRRIPRVFPDGIYGEETVRSVYAFQRSAGLGMTGRVDYETWKRLHLASAEVSTSFTQPVTVAVFREPLLEGKLSPGDKSHTVCIIQVMLNRISIEDDAMSEVEINGIYDSATAAAVTELQRSAGIEPNGVLDRQTWDVLALQYNKYVIYN